MEAKKALPRLPVSPAKPVKPQKKHPMTFLPIAAILLALYVWGNGDIGTGLIIAFGAICVYVNVKNKLNRKYELMLSNYMKEFETYEHSFQNFEIELQKISTQFGLAPY